MSPRQLVCGIASFAEIILTRRERIRRIHARNCGAMTGGRVANRIQHGTSPRPCRRGRSRGATTDNERERELLRIKKFRGGVRAHARGSRSPARSGSNPLTAGVAPFPPATTRQPLTRRLSPGPRAVDLPSPTYPTTPAPAPPAPYYHHLSRHLRETAALPAAGVYYRGDVDPLRLLLVKSPNFLFSPFFFSFSLSLYFRQISKSCEYRFPMSPYGTKIEGLLGKSHISNLRKLRKRLR
ncbi:uncharacterized protein LOC112460518 isoform X1 [Temnothorax curvispinosus]|uniref:Uncharacterized protein LOC112460518 isoform X1 n=1 Tax=Temnothorax curvispinosus TaxID=300111 RepID=A0A6J1QF75_9HYME|nr:uncharacterized protein LOC112460518 isoform X1 [Temnothorax curvispinosus]